MREISAAGLAKLASKQGTEPICIVEIDWIDGSTAKYADRTVLNIPGKIVEVGELDDAVNLAGNSGSTQLSLTLDDTDGSIKAILDSHDPHYRPARVYQYFTGLDISDRFLLFSGVVTTPLSWNERDRTVKLTILSQLEDREIGFSAEEGGFEYLPASMVNKPWPVIFGTVINNPALRVEPAITGTTLTPVGILAGDDLMLSLPSANKMGFELDIAHASFQLGFIQEVIAIFQQWYNSAQSDATDQQASPSDQQAYQQIAATLKAALDGYQTQAVNILNQQILQALMNDETKEECVRLRRKKKIDEANLDGLGDNPICILGGEDFPQGVPVTIEIEGGLFTGTFNGTQFTVTDRNSDELTQAAYAAYNAKLLDQDVCSALNTTWKAVWHESKQVPAGYDATGIQWTSHTKDLWYSSTPNEAAVADRQPVIQQFWAEPGAQVTLYTGTGDQTVYIVSVTPGTVLSVRAFKTVSSTGLTRLVDVPADLYTVRSVTYGTITAIEVVLAKPLSHIINEGWHDELYVTFSPRSGRTSRTSCSTSSSSTLT